MKHPLISLLTCVAISLPMATYSQVNIALDDACHSDTDLIDSVVEIIQSGSSSLGYLSTAEQTQIQTVLNDEISQDLSVSERLSAVLQACSDGRILQSRFANVIGTP